MDITEANVAKNNERLTRWVKRQGAKVNGVKPDFLTGKGNGIKATRNIKVS